MTIRILARPERDVTSLLAPTTPTAQKNTIQRVLLAVIS